MHNGLGSELLVGSLGDRDRIHLLSSRHDMAQGDMLLRVDSDSRVLRNEGPDDGDEDPGTSDDGELCGDVEPHRRYFPFIHHPFHHQEVEERTDPTRSYSTMKLLYLS